MILLLDSTTRDGQLNSSGLVADQRPTPEQTLEECERLKLVVKLTRSLPPSQRTAMQLRQRDDGLSIKEAAEVLGEPVGPLKAHLPPGQVTPSHQRRWSKSRT